MDTKQHLEYLKECAEAAQWYRNAKGKQAGTKQQLAYYTDLAKKTAEGAARWNAGYLADAKPSEEVARNLWGNTATEIQLKMRAAEAEVMKQLFYVGVDMAKVKADKTVVAVATRVKPKEPPAGVTRSDTRGIERRKVTPVPIKRGAAPREPLHWTQVEAPVGPMRMGGMWGAQAT